jgi:hypothetical protein
MAQNWIKHVILVSTGKRREGTDKYMHTVVKVFFIVQVVRVPVEAVKVSEAKKVPLRPYEYLFMMWEWL